jgi:hypothetical protein
MKIKRQRENHSGYFNMVIKSISNLDLCPLADILSSHHLIRNIMCL